MRRLDHNTPPPILFITWFFRHRCQVDQVALEEFYKSIETPVGCLEAAVWSTVPCRAYPLGVSQNTNERNVAPIPAFEVRVFRSLVPGISCIGGVAIEQPVARPADSPRVRQIGDRHLNPTISDRWRT